MTLEHVVAASIDVAEEPVWELTDAIGEGRGADALALLARLARGGAAPPLVLGALASHFRRLVRLRSGGSLGVPPFVRQKLESQARATARRVCVACLGAIHETDLALKGSGALPPQLALERLVHRAGGGLGRRLCPAEFRRPQAKRAARRSRAKSAN